MILAIDPGRGKTGLAVVEEDGSLIRKEVVPTAKLETALAQALKTGVRAIAMGNGTYHREVKKRTEDFLSNAEIRVPVALVNEKYTTEIGKKWYMRDYKPTGWARFLPAGMRVPTEPVDDYVAWVIGCIYLGLVPEEDVGHSKP